MGKEGGNGNVGLAHRREELRLNPAANLLCGSLGGLCSLLVGHPFDTVKVRLQTAAPGGGRAGALACAAGIVARDGPAGLSRGAAGVAALALPRFAAIFHGNALGRNLYAGRPPAGATATTAPPGEPSPAGEVMFGGLFSQLLVVPCLVAPLERVKVLLQTNVPFRHEGQISCLRFVLGHSGLRRGLFKGVALTFCRDVPSFSTYFLVYDRVKAAALRNVDPEEDYRGWAAGTMLAGGLAGVSGWAVAIPMDTAKNRHQASMEHRSSLDTVSRLLRSEGVAGFYRGAAPILARAFPANAAAFLGYELALAWAARWWPREPD